MSLTLGTGPFSRGAAGDFGAATRLGDPVVFVEPHERRIRGWAGGELAVDTRAARMLHRTGAFAQWWVPQDDLVGGLLTPTDARRDDPLGSLRLWDLRLGDRHVEAAGHDLAEPADGVPDLAGLVAVEFGALDRWQEEDEEVIGHPRDPYHRIDTRRSSEHVVVRVGDHVVADSGRPVKLFETGLPPRWYVPLDDVAAHHLAASVTRTICPYKGVASYHSVTVGDTVVHDGAWHYPQPFGEALAVAGCLSFLGDGLEITVDGHRAPGT